MTPFVADTFTPAELRSRFAGWKKEPTDECVSVPKEDDYKLVVVRRDIAWRKFDVN